VRRARENPKITSEKKVIIFGGTGYLGRVLSEHLSFEYKIISVSRSDSNTEFLEKNSRIKILNSPPGDWIKLIENHKPNVVICAQWEGVAKEDRNDLEKQISNIALQVQLAECAKKLKIENFITFGSQAEFTPTGDDIPEIKSEGSISAYGRVKSELQSKLEEIFTGSNTRFTWARIFSVYGPLDTSDSLVNGIISSVMQDSIYEINNPGVTWSFLHEEDFSKAIKLIVSRKSLQGIVNIGNPDLISLGDLPALLNNNKIIVKDNPASFKNFRIRPITKKMTYEGWSPTIEFRDGFAATLKYRQHLKSGANE
jgi:nucleoside-diphosphate-sugar epimerase